MRNIARYIYKKKSIYVALSSAAFERLNEYLRCPLPLSVRALECILVTDIIGMLGDWKPKFSSTRRVVESHLNQVISRPRIAELRRQTRNFLDELTLNALVAGMRRENYNSYEFLCVCQQLLILLRRQLRVVEPAGNNILRNCLRTNQFEARDERNWLTRIFPNRSSE